MIAFFKSLLQRLPWRRSAPERFAPKTSQALRQLNRRYQRQKRLWVYSVLYSLGLMATYVIFAVFLPGLWEYVIPIAWIVLAGVVISILQVRRCNDVIGTLRGAHTVQYQIEKAEAEKAEAEPDEENVLDQDQAAAEEEEEEAPADSAPSINGSQKPPESPDRPES